MAMQRSLVRHSKIYSAMSHLGLGRVKSRRIIGVVSAMPRKLPRRSDAVAAVQGQKRHTHCNH